MAETPSQPLPEYAEAFRSIGFAKNVFLFLLGLSILIQILAFIGVHFLGVLDDAAEISAGTKTATTAPAGWLDADSWHYTLKWILPATKFIAVVAAMLLSLTILIGLKVSLLGRLGGVAGLTSAMFWSLILLVMVIPWQQILRGEIACGATYNLGELISRTRAVRESWGAENVAARETIFYYGRFLAYPIVTMLVWLITQAKFARGRRRMSMTAAVEAE